MKATGIVRRIDDLGRVVIPREVRRTLRIQEGDPLELFIEDGCVLFKRYNAFDDRSWQTAKDMLSHILSCDFCILNKWGEVVVEKGSPLFDLDNLSHFNIYEIRVTGELIAKLITAKDAGDELDNITAQKVLQSFLKSIYE